MKRIICALFAICTVLSLIFIVELTPITPFAKANASESGVAPSIAHTKRNLKDCLTLLQSSQGGWCEMRVAGKEPSIANVYPTRSGHLAGWGRQSSVLGAWGGAAYDAENHVMYFTGGGHADYGGNEIYAFDLDAGEWRRLTEPSPLDHLSYDWGSTSSYIWIPDTRAVPGSAHTYDGLIYRPGTKTLFYSMRRAANGAKVKTGEDDSSQLFIADGAEPQQYEFNPSATETRNDIAPLSWRKIGAQPFSYPRSAALSDGTIIIGTNSRVYRVAFDSSGQIASSKELFSHADYGDGSMLYDASRKIIWSIHARALKGYKLSGEQVYSTRTQDIRSKSLALDASGNPVVWDGCTKVATYLPETNKWDIVDWGLESPTNCSKNTGMVYGKWAHIGNDVFVGISSDEHGVWVYKKGTPSAAAHPKPQ